MSQFHVWEDLTVSSLREMHEHVFQCLKSSWIWDFKSSSSLLNRTSWRSRTSLQRSQFVFELNCFCGMVDQQKTFSLISNRYHYQRISPSGRSAVPRAGFEPAQNLSLGFVQENCDIHFTTTPRFVNQQRFTVV